MTIYYRYNGRLAGRHETDEIDETWAYIELCATLARDIRDYDPDLLTIDGIA